jgi:hypothetical protein
VLVWRIPRIYKIPRARLVPKRCECARKYHTTG